MFTSLRTALVALPMSLITLAPCSAALLDTFDTADGFNDSFNGTTAVANGDGTVTLTRTVANTDAGINWTDNGFKIPIVSNELLRLTPTTDINGGYYSVNMLLFDASDQYITEKIWLSDTNSTDAQEIPDIETFVNDPSAASFVLRFRIQPFNVAGAAFAFDQIEITTDTSLAGDINEDGFVGIADLNIVLGNWNAGTPPTTGNATIPEPASLALLGLGGLALLRRWDA